MQSLMILGRQSALGLAELESLYGADKLQPVGSQAVIIDIDPCLLAFDRLGGSIKFAKMLTRLDTIDWHQIEKFLLQVSPDHSQQMPPGKMQLGLSLYGFDIKLPRLEATGLSLKKAIRKTGRPVRLIPNKTLELNAAQVTHNHLTGPTGWELLFIRDGSQTVIAQTIKVQDIEAYTLRDRGRPKRDAKVGMLPPKLAQIIINLASGPIPETKLQNICDIPAGQPIPPQLLDQTLLDPFCGTSVVLQEALLMGYEIYGTDLDARMVEYSRQNLQWLQTTYPELRTQNSELLTADATSYKWPTSIDLVASETYLGRPFISPPSTEILKQTVAECNLIIKKFMQNIYSQLQPGTRLCLAIPAWETTSHSSVGWNLNQKKYPPKADSTSIRSPLKAGMTQFRHLPLVDQIKELGYTRVSFEHAGNDDLIYHRPGQIVARELLVLNRK